MKKIIIFILFFAWIFNAIASSLYLGESEISALKAKALLGDPSPSKKLALYYDYYEPSKQGRLNAAIYYYINGKYGDVRSTLRSHSILFKDFGETRRLEPTSQLYLDMLEGENDLLKDFLRYRISAKKDLDVELEADLKAKNVDSRFFYSPQDSGFLRFSINDIANLLDGELEALYDLLVQSNPLAVKRFFFNPSRESSFRYLGGLYICSILGDDLDILAHIKIADSFKKTMMRLPVETLGDILNVINSKDLAELKIENSLYSNFLLLQYYLFKGEELEAEKYKEYLRENNVNEKLLELYEVKDGYVLEK